MLAMIASLDIKLMCVYSRQMLFVITGILLSLDFLSIQLLIIYIFHSQEFDVCDAESNKMILKHQACLVNFQANALDLYELRCDNIIVNSIIKKIALAVASGILVNKELLDSDSTLLEELLVVYQQL